MDSAVNSEVYSCIRELYAIANELEDAAGEVKASIQGMNTGKYTNDLYSCAQKYRNAARNLERLR
jgi:hypothetical protein